MIKPGLELSFLRATEKLFENIMQKHDLISKYVK